MKRLRFLFIVVFVFAVFIAFGNAYYREKNSDEYIYVSPSITKNDNITNLYEHIIVNVEKHSIKADYIFKNDGKQAVNDFLIQIPVDFDSIVLKLNGSEIKNFEQSAGYCNLKLDFVEGEAKKVSFEYVSKKFTESSDAVIFNNNNIEFSLSEKFLNIGNRPSIEFVDTVDNVDNDIISSDKNIEIKGNCVQILDFDDIVEIEKDSKEYELLKKAREQYINGDSLGALLTTIDCYNECLALSENWNEKSIWSEYFSYYLYIYYCKSEYNQEVEKFIKEDMKTEDGYNSAVVYAQKYYYDDNNKDRVSLKGKIIYIDPGHQSVANLEQEPIYPGSTETKEKNTVGGERLYEYQGIYECYEDHKIYEYEENLKIADILKSELESFGAKVYLTREENEVDISNIERAEMANKANAHISIKIHCDSYSDSSVNGTTILIPSKEHLKSSKIYDISKEIAQYLKSTMENKEMGYHYSWPFSFRNITERSDIVGFNYSDVPTILIECCFLTGDEDFSFINSWYYSYYRMASNISIGLDKYFRDPNVIKYYKENGYENYVSDEDKLKQEILKLSVELEGGNKVENLEDTLRADSSKLEEQVTLEKNNIKYLPIIISALVLIIGVCVLFWNNISQFFSKNPKRIILIFMLIIIIFIIALLLKNILFDEKMEDKVEKNEIKSEETVVL